MSRMVWVVVLLAAASACSGDPVKDPMAGMPHATPGSEAGVAYWTCPMHPSVHATGPGSCPICGMTLRPVTAAELASASVTIPPDGRRRFGIETAPVVAREMKATIHGVGNVVLANRGLSDVTLKVEGFVRDARVTERGASVRRGETLLTLYSPPLLVAQQELLAALQQQRDGDLTAGRRADAARQRLRLWDMTEGQIDAMVASGRASEAVAVLSPVTGRVIEAEVVAGQMAAAGMRLYRIADTSKVWVEAALPEAEAAAVRAGQGVVVRVAGAPDRVGTVKEVLPSVDPETRTATVRIDTDNQDGRLVADAWVSVDVEVGGGSRLAVPESAVLYTGPRRVVFVDEGGDKLVPREVHIGARADGWVVIEDGLAAGDLVVVAGNFLVAADARIQHGDGAW